MHAAAAAAIDTDKVSTVGITSISVALSSSTQEIESTPQCGPESDVLMNECSREQSDRGFSHKEIVEGK